MTAVTVDAPFVSLPLKVLHESPTNPRQRFEEKPMKDLVESVRAHGVLQPILVRDRQQPGDEPGSRYEIVAGARRFRAAREAGLLEIPCIVRELTDKQTLEVQFVENLQRADLHPLDEGYGYKRLHDEHGYTVDHLAAKLGKSVGYVYGRMQLAKLPVKAQTLFFDGAIDLSHAQLVARIPVPELADKAAAAIAKGDHSGVPMTYRSAVDYVRRNFQCNLKDAPFPTQDRDLVPDAGPCGRCPKRTGNQKDLFGGADGVGADVCTDPGCFELKTKRHFQVQKDEVLAAGGKCIEGAKAREFLYGDKLIDPDTKCYLDPKDRTYKQLVKGQPMQTVLLQGQDGQALIRWDRAAAMKAAIENGHTFLRPVKAASSSGTRNDSKVLDEHRKWIEKRRIEGLVRDKVTSLIVPKAEALTPDEAIRILAKSTDPSPQVCKRRGWKNLVEAAKFAGSAPVGSLQGLVLEDLWENGGEKDLPTLLGIDLKAITKQVAAEEKAKAKATEKAKSAKPTARAKALGKALDAAKLPKAKAAKKAKPGKAKAPAMDETKFDVHHGASSRRGSVVAGD
jgi:ParB/RepB/Spo0J family partition protein